MVSGHVNHLEAWAHSNGADPRTGTLLNSDGVSGVGRGGAQRTRKGGITGAKRRERPVLSVEDLRAALRQVRVLAESRRRGALPSARRDARLVEDGGGLVRGS